MEFQDRLDSIWDRISNKKFLENKGVGSEVKYYIFDYEACDEQIIRQKIKDLVTLNNPENDGFQIVEYDIYKMILNILAERGYLDKCIKFEKEKGRQYLYNAIAKLLRLTTDNNMIVNRIIENTPGNSVVFLTGIGKAYPFVRAHNVLNNLHQVFDKVPVILFYPGIWNGQSLSLFGTIADGNYYRARPLIK